MARKYAVTFNELNKEWLGRCYYNSYYEGLAVGTGECGQAGKREDDVDENVNKQAEIDVCFRMRKSREKE